MLTDDMPPPSRNHLVPTAGDTPATAAASSVDTPRAIAAQNRCRSSRRATGGRPGDRRAGLPVARAAQPFGRPIATPRVRVLRRLVESAHYLKVGVALQMVKTDAAAEGEGDAAAVGAKALDEVIAQLGERTMPELAGPGGRARAKAKLTAAVAKRYDGDVMDVYFTEFVMQ